MIFHGSGICTVVTQARWLCREPALGVSGHRALAGRLVSCLLRSGSRRRPAWCPSLTRSTMRWPLSPEAPFLRALLDPPMSIGPLKVSSVAPLSRAGGHLFPSIVRHTCGSLSKTAHLLRKATAVTTSVGRMCAVTWHRWLAWCTQSLGPASFLPAGGRAFGHLALRSFRGPGLPAFSHLPPHRSLLIAGSGPNLGGGSTVPSSPFSSVRS